MQRDEKIDIIKGVAISCVVLGHCGAPFTRFIYLFHVAAFFIASGFIYKTSYSDTFGGLRTLFWKRVKGLWIPFFGFSAFFLLCWNLLVKFHLYNGDSISFLRMTKLLFLKIFMIGAGSGPMCGALWFLFSLFSITMIYGVIDYVLKKLNVSYKRGVHVMIALFFFLCNYYLIKSGSNVSQFNHVMGPYIAYVLGVEISCWKLSSLKGKSYFFICLMTLFLLFVCNEWGRIEIARGIYTSPQFFIIASTSGFLFLYSIAFFISKATVCKKTFTYLGRNSMCIIGLHFLGFKLTTFLQIKIFDLPIQKLTAFPYLINSSAWWLVYFVVSIAFCLLLNFIYKRVFNLIRKRFVSDCTMNNVALNDCVNG